MKTTKEDFEIFKVECKKWINFFGLTDWMIGFLHVKDGESLAWVELDNDNSVATVYFNKEWIDNKVFYKEDEVRLIAFHEICEILLAGLDFYTRERFNVSEDGLLQARHKLIHILENSVYEKLGGIR